METREDKFITWLQDEIERRGWTLREAARQAEISHATIPNIINRKRNPGKKFCISIARAFKITPEEVYRRAGLLPNLAEIDELGFKGLYDIMRHLSPEERKEIYEIARLKLTLKQDRNENAAEVAK